MTDYLKLSGIRAALEETLGRPVSGGLADNYTHRNTFPAPAIAAPIRLWDREDVEAWMAWKRGELLEQRSKTEATQA